jgi:hypothetical protein
VAVNGSADALVASGFDSPTGIAVDSKYVYVAVSSDTNGDHIYRLDR